MRPRKASLPEVAAYLAWAADLCKRANRRWLTIRPNACGDLVRRDILTHATLCQIRDAGLVELPKGFNSSQASRWLAAIYAESPDEVRQAASTVLRRIYERAESPV